MSVEILVRLVCDNCQSVIDGKVGRSTTRWWESYSDAQKEANRDHWLTLPRYGRTRHLCGNCADGKPAICPKCGHGTYLMGGQTVHTCP